MSSYQRRDPLLLSRSGEVALAAAGVAAAVLALAAAAGLGAAAAVFGGGWVWPGDSAGVVAVVATGIMTLRKPLLVPLMLLVFLSSPWWAPKTVTDRVMFTFTQEADPAQVRVGQVRLDTSTSDRLRSWQNSFTWWKRYPILGTGVTGGPFMDAMYPRVLSETGIVGIVAFFILLGALFRMGLMAYRKISDPFWRGVALGFILGHIGLLVHAVGANTFLIVRIMEPFWLFAALVAREVLAAQADEMAKDKPPTSPIFRGRGGASGTGPPWTNAGLAGQRKL